MLTRTESTNSPKGLGIKRKGNQFTLSWKKDDKNYSDGQQLQYAVNSANLGWSIWKSITIGSSVTSKVVTLDFSDFYPASTNAGKLKGIRFRVRGQRETRVVSEKYWSKKDKKYKHHDVKINYDWSAWSSYSWDILIPNLPKTKATYNTVAKSTFSWDVETSNTSQRVFRRIEWEAILKNGNTAKNGKDVTGWNSNNIDYRSGTSLSDNSSVAITENLDNFAESSTRWFRVRAVGSRGASDWAYSYHRYALPNAPKNVTAEATSTDDSKIILNVDWQSSTSNSSKPINKTIVQWAIVTPEAEYDTKGNPSLVCPDDAFDSPSESPNIPNLDGPYKTIISGSLGTDKALFVRVVTYHDGVGNPSEIVLATTNGRQELKWKKYSDDGSVQKHYEFESDPVKLANPVITRITDNTSLHTATVEAENRSEVSGSYLAVFFYAEAGRTIYKQIVGVIPWESTSVNVKYPAITGAEYTFGVQALVAKKTYYNTDIPSYAVTDTLAESALVYDNGSLPKMPSNVTAEGTIIDGRGTIQVTWGWAWSEADAAVVSWADHRDAWNSTDPPEEYELSSIDGSQLNISDVETGKVWYVRVRLKKGTGDNANYGAWSDIIPVNLKSRPSIPTLVLSQDIITPEGSVQASWGYSSADGAPQAQADLCEAFPDEVYGGFEYGTPFDNVTSAQYATIYAEEREWNAGEVHYIAVRVTSAAGEESDGWSVPVPITIADAPEINVVSTSLQDVTITDDAEEHITTTMKGLTVLPLTANITGAGEGGRTYLTIERAQNYTMARPDDSNRESFKGETIAMKEITGEGQIKINIGDVLGYLDDGCLYNLICEIKDTYGQTASETIEFIVKWSHQAIAPDANIVIDYAKNAAAITPIAPEGAISGDTCDIYRLSADKPELIYPGATFGETYIDPYPALGAHGGHRVVFKTADGDYITNDADGNQPAWTDFRADAGDYIYSVKSLIDFDGIQIPLMYNVSISNEWEKEFTETKYLGGSIQGDWMLGVSRSVSVSVEMLNVDDEETILNMRRLANYTGICHIRTIEGTSIPCDIQVKEDRPFDNWGVNTSFNLTITRVDPEGYEGLTLDEWSEGSE